MAKSIVNKAKDVATLKTFRENFFKDDGSLQQWFAHGATEAANMVLHGHPAPVYAGNVSPPNLGSNEVQQTDMDQQQAAVPEPGQKMSFLAQKMQEIQQQPEIEDPEMEWER